MLAAYRLVPAAVVYVVSDNIFGSTAMRKSICIDLVRNVRTRFGNDDRCDLPDGAHQERNVAMRSSSCSTVAIAVGGPPHTRRSSLWIAP